MQLLKNAIAKRSVKYWLFIDEQGTVKFGPNSDPHFGLAAVATTAPGALCGLLEAVRHRWLSEVHLLNGAFHAQTDCWDVRNAVYESFLQLPIARCDVVAINKDAVVPSLRSPEAMYALAARLLLKFVVPRLNDCDQLSVVLARWSAVADLPRIVRPELQESRRGRRVIWPGPVDVIQLPSSAHPGLQAADYVAFAAHRERSRSDSRLFEMLYARDRKVSHWIAFAKNR
ncbi:MAG: DUF3800 domain-containing protein [Dehalococcoidia bacterium]|nr:DUF3800 domain-containing protein [Dehalococcoidia bacterium]